MKHTQSSKYGLSRIAGAVLAGLMLVAASGVRGEEQAKPADVYTPIDIRQIKIGGELGRRMDITVSNNLLKIDIDKDFLAAFAARNARGNDAYIGLGKTLDAMVRLAASTGSDALTARKKHVVDELVRIQQPDGYIGTMLPEERTWRLWDLHEQSYIIYALIDDSRLFGEERSLAAARKLADYILGRWPTKPADWVKAKQLPCNEWLSTINLKRAFLTLHEATGDRRYLDFIVRDLKSKEWEQAIVLGRHGMLEGHSYSYFSHCLVQLELYRLDPQAALLGPTQRAMDFLLAKDGMAITGGAGHDECWSDEQRGTGNLGETCSTLYQTLVYDSLLRMKGESRWGDLIERTLYNAAFAAQSPDGRKLRYYVPFEGPRVYFDRDTYCCPGNYRRLVGTMPSLIYYQVGNGIAVNLYTASQVTLKNGADIIVVRQETDYPNSGRVMLLVEPQKPTAFPLLLRIPQWCSHASVSINGTPSASTAKTGEFLKIDRTWQRGDKVTLDMAMPWRFVAGRKTQTGRAAVMRGPVVYALNPKQITLSAAGTTKETPPLGLDILVKRLVLLPETAELIAAASVRPGGTACRIKADLDKADKGAYTLILTEFPDPDGQATYFLLPDMKAAVNDELMQAK
jgi:hypothetical protein